MIGLIQTVLMDLIQRRGGAEAVAQVKARAGLAADFKFRIDTNYSDSEFRTLLEATCDVLKVTVEQAIALYADDFGREALRRFPAFFAMSPTSREFLERQPQLHNSLAAGAGNDVRGGVGKKFTIRKTPTGIEMTYCSPNRLEQLYVALARWIVDHYRDEADISIVRAATDSDPSTLICIEWRRFANGAPVQRAA